MRRVSYHRPFFLPEMLCISEDKSLSLSLSLRFDRKIVSGKKKKKERLPSAVTFTYVRSLNSQRIFKVPKPLVFLYHAPSSPFSSSSSSPSFAFLLFPLFLLLFFLHFVCSIHETNPGPYEEENFCPIDGNETSRPWNFRHKHKCFPPSCSSRKPGASSSTSTSVISIFTSGKLFLSPSSILKEKLEYKNNHRNFIVITVIFMVSKFFQIIMVKHNN